MIPEYKTILYATDLSDNAANAFRHAISIARGFNGRIHLLHVLPEIEPAVMNYMATVMGEDRLAGYELEHKAEVTDRIRQRLHDFTQLELAGHPEDAERIAEIEVRHGSPVGLILETGDRIGADLVVIGTHGKGRLKYALLGSVAEKVLRKTQRPTLVVPIRP